MMSVLRHFYKVRGRSHGFQGTGEVRSRGGESSLSGRKTSLEQKEPLLKPETASREDCRQKQVFACGREELTLL